MRGEGRVPCSHARARLVPSPLLFNRRCLTAVPLPTCLQVELSLIEKLLPEEMLLYVLQFLPIHGLAAAQIVCRQWRSVGGSPSLWRAACM